MSSSTSPLVRPVVRRAGKCPSHAQQVKPSEQLPLLTGALTAMPTTEQQFGGILDPAKSLEGEICCIGL